MALNASHPLPAPVADRGVLAEARIFYAAARLAPGVYWLGAWVFDRNIRKRIIVVN